jgi:hypothetical protein
MQFAYAFKLIKDRTDGGYVVTSRDIPEAITQGRKPCARAIWRTSS